MAVKKAKTVKDEELVEKVDVVADVTEETETSTENEIDVVEETASDVEVDEPTDIEIEVDEEPSKPDVEVSVEDAVVNTAKKPNGNVKIRMRVDHKCCIAMERYDLVAGKVYTVPENVKEILNKAGLLSPL